MHGCTLSEVLTWLKEIIRDNPLFDEGNPAMIVGDAPLETALRKKRVHVNEIRSVVQRQLTMVEARRGPMSAAMLAEGLAQMGRVSVIPRPAVRAVAAPASTPSVRGVSLTEVPAGPVVLYSPVPGISQDIGGLRFKRRNRTLEDDHNREADPDQSPGLHGNIKLRKGDPV